MPCRLQVPKTKTQNHNAYDKTDATTMDRRVYAIPSLRGKGGFKEDVLPVLALPTRPGWTSCLCVPSRANQGNLSSSRSDRVASESHV